MNIRGGESSRKLAMASNLLFRSPISTLHCEKGGLEDRNGSSHSGESFFTKCSTSIWRES